MPCAVAPPKKAAAPPAVPPLDIPQSEMKPDRLENLSSIGSIDNAKPGTPKRKSRTVEAFMDTMLGKESLRAVGGISVGPPSACGSTTVLSDLRSSLSEHGFAACVARCREYRAAPQLKASGLLDHTLIA